MPHLPFQRVRHQLVRFVPAALATLFAASVQAETTLHDLFEAAWSRAVSAHVAEARQQAAEASRIVAENPWANSPALSFSEKSDRLQGALGARERELELSLPLLLPGQKRARSAFAQQDHEEARASMLAARLELAGSVRAHLWALLAASADARMAEAQLAQAEALQTDVLRRQRAGELARTDLFLAQEDSLAARSTLAEADAQRQYAALRLQQISAHADAPDIFEETVVPARALHPRAVLAEARLALARATLQQVREEARPSPELILALSDTRDSAAVTDHRALRIGMRVALGHATFSAPRLASAAAACAQAEGEWRTTLIALDNEQRTAHLALNTATLRAEAAHTRANLATERLALQEKAFALGELGLAELLRMRQATHTARLEYARAQIALGSARAQLNQANGILP